MTNIILDNVGMYWALDASGMVVSALSRDFIEDESQDRQTREDACIEICVLCKVNAFGGYNTMRLLPKSHVPPSKFKQNATHVELGSLRVCIKPIRSLVEYRYYIII